MITYIGGEDIQIPILVSYSEPYNFTSSVNITNSIFANISPERGLPVLGLTTSQLTDDESLNSINIIGTSFINNTLEKSIYMSPPIFQENSIINTRTNITFENCIFTNNSGDSKHL